MQAVRAATAPLLQPTRLVAVAVAQQAPTALAEMAATALQPQ
jgi:hypothetical protein